MVQLVIFAHELSSLEVKLDQYTGQGFKQVIKICGGKGVTLQNSMGGLESIHEGASG